jgi:putative transposase
MLILHEAAPVSDDTADNVQPRSSALRKGRHSVAGRVYFITTNITRRQRLLTPPAREAIIASLQWLRDQGRLWRLGYVIMDDHFHALLMLRDGHDLERILHSLKSFTAHAINQERGQTGNIWQPGYHDHTIRDGADLNFHLQYMHDNPVRRGWVERAEAYAWSTAHPERKLDIDWQALGFEG